MGRNSFVGGRRAWYPSGPKLSDDHSSSRIGVSSSSTQPHNCFSPGCTRRGEPETTRLVTSTQPHNCFSPGCTRRGEIETTTVSVPVPKSVRAPECTRPTYATDPDPFNFKIIRVQADANDQHTLVEVLYPNCTNYEGRKILLIGLPSTLVLSMKGMDPHFMENKSNGLLARFEPTQRGWNMGLAALYALHR